MSIASTIALMLAAATRLKSAPAERISFLEAENARLRRDLAATQALLAAAQAGPAARLRDKVVAMGGRDVLSVASPLVDDVAFPAPAGAPLTYEFCRCVPSRLDMWTARRV
jgi:hypothetical protein